MQNSKHKIRNPDRFGRLSFRYFRICFGFRYSNFGFIVLVVCSLWFGISIHSAFASTINQPPVTLGLISGLVGHWTFDGQDMAGERAYDRSGQNNTGTLTNGPTRAIGKIGQALNFDGVNDDVSTNNTVDLPGEMSVFAWIKSNTVQTDAFGDYIVASNNEAQFTLAHDTYVGGGILEARWNNERISSCEVGTITVGKWYHVGFTRTGSSGNWTCRVYINGALAKTGTGIATNPGVAGIVRIGSRQSGTYFLFDGLIDDVRIYNRALSEQEVKQLYLMGK